MTTPKSRFGRDPKPYALTAYDGVLVVDDAIGRLLKAGKPITRSNVRDYAQTTNLQSLQGQIAFDENGDLRERIISRFQVWQGAYR